MTHDPLKRLLQEADRAAGAPPPDGHDLATRARSIVRRRHRVRRGGAVLAICLVVGSVTLMRGNFLQTTPGRTQPPVLVRQDPPDIGVEQLQCELDRLRSEADFHMNLARRLRQIGRRHARLVAHRRTTPAIDVVSRVRQETEVAARFMVERADRLSRQAATEASSLQTYRRAIELFPTTRWADVARQRLSEVQHQTGEST